MKSLDPLASPDPFERYLPVCYTDDKEAIQTAMEQWKTENEMVTSIVNSIRIHMCSVICDNTVRRKEDVVFKYGDNHGGIMDQLKEKMCRVEAANKKRQV